MIVVDASAVIELVARSPAGLRVAERVSGADETLHAPHLIDVEVAHALRRLTLAGAISTRTATARLAALATLAVERYPHTDLLARIWELRENVTAYDAAYLALAEALGAPLLTCDRALLDVPGCSALVETP